MSKINDEFTQTFGTYNESCIDKKGRSWIFNLNDLIEKIRDIL